jgi:hypothetical protein
VRRAVPERVERDRRAGAADSSVVGAVLSAPPDATASVSSGATGVTCGNGSAAIGSTGNVSETTASGARPWITDAASLAA